MEILYLTPAIAAAAVAVVMSRKKGLKLLAWSVGIAVAAVFVVPCLVSFSAPPPFIFLSAALLAASIACLIVAGPEDKRQKVAASVAIAVVVASLWLMPGGPQ